jgi:hypothetical protein
MKRGNRITGHSNPQMQQFVQIATADTTTNFYAFEAVGGNAIIEVLKNIDGTEALDYFETTTKTAYQGVLYTGAFGRIKASSGELVLRKSEQ